MDLYAFANRNNTDDIITGHRVTALCIAVKKIVAPSLNKNASFVARLIERRRFVRTPLFYSIILLFCSWHDPFFKTLYQFVNISALFCDRPEKFSSITVRSLPDKTI